MTSDELLTSLNWRYAVKKFDSTKTIPSDTLAALEESLRLSPSSYGLQPWKFFVVADKATREKLLPHSWGQKQIVDCSHVVVLAVKKNVTSADADKLIDYTARLRGVPASTLEMYRGMVSGSISRTPDAEKDVWMSRQIFIALGVLMTAAAMLRVDSCPMEGFVPEKYDEILGLAEQGFASRVVAALGYRAADDPYANAVKVRYPKAEIIQTI